jgi:hypothetical protein
MYAVSSFCFVFSWAAGTAGGGRLVAGKGSALWKFQYNIVTNTIILSYNHVDVHESVNI